MLEAKKNKWFETVFALYNRNLLRRRFHSLNVAGLEFLRAGRAKTPQIIYANHSGWWDGLIAFEISRRENLDSFIIMEEKQLKKFFFFRKIGAFSVVREKPREAFKSIDYAAQLLRDKSERTLWIFPQGEILPNDSRPLVFYHGMAKVIEKAAECRVTPLAMRYEFRGEFKPEIFVRIGEPESFQALERSQVKVLTANFEKNLTRLLDRVKNDILTKNLKDYENII